MPTYARYPLTLVRGAGLRVWDDEGRGYLDLIGGLGALSLGHAHPRWVRAVTDAAATIGLTSNLVTTLPQERLATRIAARTPVDDARVFLCNSGAEANEALLKLVRKHGLRAGRPRIVALEGSFHGRTVAALAATGQPEKRAPFEPLLDWFRFVTPGDLDALDAALAPGDVAAVFLEPVLGEGGVVPLTPAYLQGVRARCDATGALLAVDEVQAGSGRVGLLAVDRGRRRSPGRRLAREGTRRRPADRRADRAGRAELRAGRARIDVRRGTGAVVGGARGARRDR